MDASNVRKEVWNQLYDADELMIPTLPYKLAPCFKGLGEAVNRLLELDVIKNTDKILVSMEKVLSDTRFKLLQEKLKLYVTTFRSPNVYCVECPRNSSKYIIKQSSSLNIERNVKRVEPSEITFDVLIVPSIAVNKSGYRIGRDDAQGELEFSVLSSLGLVDNNTLVVTLVHDMQIVEPSNSRIGGPKSTVHDLPLDIIVTPTQVINCPQHPKPLELVWSEIVPNKIERSYLLNLLRFRQWKEGKNVKLSGEEVNPETLEEPKAQVSFRKKRISLSIDQRDKSSDRNVNSPESKKGNDRIVNGSGGYRKRRTYSSNQKNLNGSVDEQSRNEKENNMKSNSQDRQGEDMPYHGRRRRIFTYGRRNRGVSKGDQNSGQRTNTSGQNGGDGKEVRGQSKNKRQDRDFKPAVYIGDLPYKLNRSELVEILSNRQVLASKVVKNKYQAHGFVVFENLDAVNDCLKKLEGLMVDDHQVKIEMTKQTLKNVKVEDGDSKPSGMEGMESTTDKKLDSIIVSLPA